MNNSSAAALDILQQAAAIIRDSHALKQPLQSVFSILRSNSASDVEASYVAPRILSLERDTLFAYPDAPTALAHADPTLPTAFATAYAGIAQDKVTAAAQLTYLLHAYAWALPSASDPVVSLFEQARTDAALAAARIGRNPEAPVLLIGGDISGVQSFIYTLSAAGATKALRARSFYLQLLTEVLARRLLNRVAMPITNLLYSGGGRFYLLVPGEAAARIDEWRREIGEFLLHRHAGELYVALGAAIFDAATLNNSERFGAQWRVLNESINADKRRRFAALDAATLADTVFAPQGHGGGVKAACVVCRYQGEPEEFTPFQPDIEEQRAPENQRVICRLCASFETLAQALHRAKFLMLTPTETQPVTGRKRVPALDVLRDLGMDIDLIHDEHALNERLPRTTLTTVLSLGAAPSPDLWQRLYAQGVVVGLRPLVNETPTLRAEDRDDPKLQRWLASNPDEQRTATGDSVKTFGMMVEQSRGVKRLGVLRMDVDDLGDIFAVGIQQTGLARVSTLSAALARFFEGWVGVLCRTLNEREGNRVYAIYSGGDDLFIVGSWDVLPHLARAIREDLRAYARNDMVRVSAGLSLHPPKFPLYQAAAAAEEALDQAKHRPGKDSFSFLDQVVGWGSDADEVFTIHSELTRFIAAYDVKHKDGLSRAALHVFQAMYSAYQRPIDQERDVARRKTIFIGRWLWFGVYQLSRMADGKNDQVKPWLAAIRDRLREGGDTPPNVGKRFIERVALAARWTQLLVRKEHE